VGIGVLVGIAVAVGMGVGDDVEVGVQVGIEEGLTAGAEVDRGAGMLVGWDSDGTHPVNRNVTSIKLACRHDRFPLAILLVLLLVILLLESCQVCPKVNPFLAEPVLTAYVAS